MNKYLFALRTWNQMSFQNRCSLLASLKHSTLLAHRAYPFIPSWVRADVQNRIFNAFGTTTK